MALAAVARLRAPLLRAPPLGQAAGRRWGWGTRLLLATAAGSGSGKDQTGVVTIEFCVK